MPLDGSVAEGMAVLHLTKVPSLSCGLWNPEEHGGVGMGVEAHIASPSRVLPVTNSQIPGTYHLGILEGGI